MASRVGVLAAHQTHSVAEYFIPRAQASGLVQSGEATRISKNLIRMVAKRSSRISFIPEELPAAEVEGTIFKAPESGKQSEADHRRKITDARTWCAMAQTGDVAMEAVAAAMSRS